MDQNNYFRAEVSQKQEELLTIKGIKENDFASKFANTYISYEKLAIISDINTLKLF